MSDELIHHMRGFAEECLRRIELNPEVSGNELHTKQTYVDIMKLCDRVPAAPQSDQPAPDDLPNRVRDDIAAWAEATHESGDQVTLEGFAEWLRHSWHWSGPALEKPTSQPSAIRALSPESASAKLGDKGETR